MTRSQISFIVIITNKTARPRHYQDIAESKWYNTTRSVDEEGAGCCCNSEEGGWMQSRVHRFDSSAKINRTSLSRSAEFKERYDSKLLEGYRRLGWNWSSVWLKVQHFRMSMISRFPELSLRIPGKLLKRFFLGLEIPLESFLWGFPRVSIDVT